MDNIKNLKEWADRELDLYIDKHATDENTEKLNDLQAAYTLLLKLVELHPIHNVENVLSFFGRLAQQKPLTPIEKPIAPEKSEEFRREWQIVEESKELGIRYYISKRLPSLIIAVDDDSIATVDSERVICHDIGSDTPFNNTYIDSYITNIVTDHIPIKFPYMGDAKVHVITSKKVRNDGSETIFMKSARDSATGNVYDINAVLLKDANGEVNVVSLDEYVKGEDK